MERASSGSAGSAGPAAAVVVAAAAEAGLEREVRPDTVVPEAQ